jgi:hypothetical protein
MGLRRPLLRQRLFWNSLSSGSEVVGTDAETCPVITTTEGTLLAPSSVCPIADASFGVFTSASSAYAGGDSGRAASTCDVVAAPNCAASVYDAATAPNCATSARDITVAPDRATLASGAQGAPSSDCSLMDVVANGTPPMGVVAIPTPLLLASSAVPDNS